MHAPDGHIRGVVPARLHIDGVARQRALHGKLQTAHLVRASLTPARLKRRWDVLGSLGDDQGETPVGSHVSEALEVQQHSVSRARLHPSSASTAARGTHLAHCCDSEQVRQRRQAAENECQAAVVEGQERQRRASLRPPAVAGPPHWLTRYTSPTLECRPGRVSQCRVHVIRPVDLSLLRAAQPPPPSAHKPQQSKIGALHLSSAGGLRRVWLRLNANRDFATGVAVLLSLSWLAWHEFQRDGAPRLQLLQLYDGGGVAVDAASLCLRGLVDAASQQRAELPLNDTQPYADSVLDAQAETQFRRLPRAGDRGFGPQLLFYNVFAQRFTGDYSLTRAKLGRRAPLSRVHVPVPMRGCGAADAPGGDVDRLPEPCDKAAARAGRPGQGYLEIGSITHTLMASLPDRDVLATGDPWRTCAVVGAAPIGDAGVREHTARVVDAADVVIRVGVPQPAEQTLGRRTNIRVFGPSDVAAFTSATPTGVQPWHKKGTVGAQRLVMLMAVTSEAALNATLHWKAREPLADVEIADGDFLQWALDQHGGTAPSAAFYALLLASTRCDRVLLFAMSNCPPPAEASPEAPLVREEERITRVLLARNAHHFRFWTAGDSRREQQVPTSP